MTYLDRAFRPVTTTETSIRILELLQEHDGLTLAELTTQMDAAKSTIHRHLLTLEEHHVITRHDGEFRVGLRLLDCGLSARDSHVLYRAGKDHVDELAEKTGEQVWMHALENGQGRVLYTSGGGPLTTDRRLGTSRLLHQMSVGKAMLAELPEHDMEAILDHWGLPPLTEETITDRETLIAELEEIREQGYALNFEEGITGIHAIGCAVIDVEDTVIGGISVTGPAQRLTEEYLREEIANDLLPIVNEIEVNLRYL